MQLYEPMNRVNWIGEPGAWVEDASRNLDARENYICELQRVIGEQQVRIEQLRRQVQALYNRGSE